MSLELKAVLRVLMRERERLFAYVWSLVGDADLAEDVLQEVSILATEKGTDVADEERLAVWLRRTARFKSLEELRRKRRAPLPLDEDVIDLLDPHWADEETASEARTAEALRTCVDRLTPHSRRIVTLRYVDGLRSGAIAAMLGRKAATVYQALTRIHRALDDCVRRELAVENEAW